MTATNCSDVRQRWRAWIRPLLILFYCLFVIIVLPLLIVNSVKDGFRRKDQLILIGGLFVLTALPISFWHITQHIVHFTKPILQKHIIRILWMVPIYALNAWMGLLVPWLSIYMDFVRECYEAYVIYNFMVYLLNYLNLEMDLEATLELKPPVKHIFPLCYMTPWTMGREFVHNCKHGILQYTVVRLLTTFTSVICKLCGVYGEGSFSMDVAYPYIIAINNVSQFIAMYCLVLFYQANKLELRKMKPLPKFLCIKAVVFLTFFQGVLINILVYFGFIKNIFGSEDDDDYQILSSKLQDFLICIEMFFAAVAHHYSFPHDPFHMNVPEGYNQHANGAWYNAFVAMWDISDVQQDVTEHLGVVGSSLSRRLRGRTAYQMPRGGTESDYLIQATGSSTSTAAPSCYQSGLHYAGNMNALGMSKTNNKYGAVDDQKQNPNEAITIVKGAPKQYSPHHGAPRSSNFFQSSLQQDSSTSSVNKETKTTLDMSKSDSTSTFTGLDKSMIKKSDSSASDWLSTPTDEMMGIDVKGVQKDTINYKDPKV